MEQKITIINDTSHRVGYIIDGFPLRTLEGGASLQIPLTEAQALSVDKGGRVLLEEKLLLLGSPDEYDLLGIYPDGYELSADEIRLIIASNEIQKLDDTLAFCSNSTLDKIVDITIKEVNDYNIIQLVSNRSKKDIVGAKEELKEQQVAASAPKRR